MVPVCQALQAGGIEAAFHYYTEIKDNQEYFFDGDELVSLVYQLIGVQKIDLAIQVLKLNLLVFPKHTSSWVLLAKLYLRQEDRPQAEAALREARALAPNSKTVAELLTKVSSGN
jgi:predicted Zn-dependent protease